MEKKKASGLFWRKCYDKAAAKKDGQKEIPSWKELMSEWN